MNRRTQSILGAFALPLVLLTAVSVAWMDRGPNAPQVAAAGSDVVEYPSMTALRKVEQSGVAYDLTWTVTRSPLIVIAPHGGAIESRTSEIAGAIAGDNHTQCQFQGKLPDGQNGRLHVTSERWDVEECLILIAQRPHALSIHGASKSGKVVYVGGLDTVTGAKVAQKLREARFTVVQPAPADIAGTSPQNFVNKDADGAGVQLELTKDLRLELFPTKAEGPTEKGQEFVDAVRSAYT